MACEDEAVSGGGELGRPILLWFGPIVSPTLTPGICFLLFWRLVFTSALFFLVCFMFVFLQFFFTFLFYEYVLFFLNVRLLIPRQWLLKGGVFACGGELRGDGL